jgi:LacI family transcriptional regulator
VVTIKDIAKMANVSYSTVSKALNDSPLVKPETKRRIQEIARQAGYQKNLLARHLVSGQSRLIGLVLTNVHNPTFSTLAKYLYQALKERQYHLIFAISAEEVELFSQLRVDGLILWGEVVRNHPYLLNVVRQGTTPTLVLGSDEPLPVPSISFDRRAGIAEAVRYLKSFGHRRIGIIGGPQEIKIRAFLEALAVEGLQGSDDLLFPTEPSFEGGYRALRYADPTRKLPTAFIGLNNLVTKGALRALLEMGYDVPNDISLIGYDNLPDMQNAEVPLTSVGPLLEDAAERAAAAMADLIQKRAGKDDSAPVPVYRLPSVLIPRASVAACRESSAMPASP